MLHLHTSTTSSTVNYKARRGDTVAKVVAAVSWQYEVAQYHVRSLTTVNSDRYQACRAPRTNKNLKHNWRMTVNKTYQLPAYAVANSMVAVRDVNVEFYARKGENERMV